MKRLSEFDWLALILSLTLLAMILCTQGCFRSKEQSRTVYRGTVGDMPISVEADGTAERQSGVEVSQVVSAAVKTAMAAASGDFGKALEAIKAGIAPPPAKDYTTELVTGGAGLASTLAMLLAKRSADKRAEDHKADAEEGWAHVMNKSDPAKS